MRFLSYIWYPGRTALGLFFTISGVFWLTLPSLMHMLLSNTFHKGLLQADLWEPEEWAELGDQSLTAFGQPQSEHVTHWLTSGSSEGEKDCKGSREKSCRKGGAWWHIPIIPALGKLRQVDSCFSPARGTERKLANGRDIKAEWEEWASRDVVCSLVFFSHVASCRTESVLAWRPSLYQSP